MADVETKLGQRAAAALNRLQARHGVMRLELDFVMLFYVLAHLQLALRHPEAQGVAAEEVRWFMNHVITWLEQQEPDLGPLLRAGDDPRFDVGRREVPPEGASAACELELDDDGENGGTAK